MDLPQFLFYYKGSANDTKVEHSDKVFSPYSAQQQQKMPAHSADDCSVLIILIYLSTAIGLTPGGRD